MNLAPRMSGKKIIKYLANNLCTVYQICMYIICAYTNPGMLHLQGKGFRKRQLFQVQLAPLGASHVGNLGPLMNTTCQEIHLKTVKILQHIDDFKKTYM